MTKKLQALALTGSALLAISIGATPAQAAPATANASAKAKILKQLTITKNTDLDFGTIVSGANAGTVTIASNGGRTCDTTLTCTGGTTAATFTVTGSNNHVVTVSAPASVTLNSGANSMTASLAAPTTLNLGNSGSTGTPLNFGGTLSVAANQADGDYASVNFNVTVDYQ